MPSISHLETADLKKLLPKKLEATMVPASKLTQAVDGTAFCQLGKNTNNFLLSWCKCSIVYILAAHR